MTTMTPWTKLQGTSLWSKAEDAYSVPAGRHYHNMGHVRRLYEHAFAFGMPYCPHLDRAILAHDVIIDGKPDEVERSAAWLSMRGDNSRTARALILSTQTHRPCADNRLILLDLSDFIYPDVSRRNTEALAMEAEAIKGEGCEAFVENSIRYLSCLSRVLSEGAPKISCSIERNRFARIVKGMNQVVEDLRSDIGDVTISSPSP